MTFAEIAAALTEAFGAEVVTTSEAAHNTHVKVPTASLREVAHHLRDTEGLAFDNLSVLTASDYPPERFELTYHLWSYAHHHLLVLKVDVPREQPEAPTVADIWPAAEWHEREQYDLLGVVFTNHPDLRRLLLPEDWPGHPLRKDWVEPAAYHGMRTTRQSANALFKELSGELVKARPLRAVLVYDDGNSDAARTGELLARRLALADIETDRIPVGDADPASLPGYDLVIFGASSRGLLFPGSSPRLGGFIDLLPDLDGLPCALYVVYASNPAAAIHELDAKVARKRGRIIARGAVIRGRPEQDPDDLAAAIIDHVRTRALPRPPAPAPVAAAETEGDAAEQAAAS